MDVRLLLWCSAPCFWLVWVGICFFDIIGMAFGRAIFLFWALVYVTGWIFPEGNCCSLITQGGLTRSYCGAEESGITVHSEQGGHLTTTPGIFG